MRLRDVWRSIKLAFQKLDTLFLNDMKLFLRDRKALVLVLLTPFLILSILINIYGFSGIAENIKGVKLGVCDKGNANFDLESDIFEPIRFNGECEQEVEELVSKGELRGAIVIPEDFRQNLIDGKGTKLLVYIDNTKSTTALVTSNAVKAYASDLNEKMGEAFIREAWKQLDELNENLRVVVENLKKAEPVAVELQKRMRSTKSELDGIDFERYQMLMSDMIYYLDLMESLLDEAEMSAQGIKPDLITPTLPIVVGNSSDLFTTYKQKSAGLRTAYCTTNLTIIPNPGCILIDEVDGIVLNVEQEITTYHSDINDKIARLNRVSEDLTESLNSLGKVLDSTSENNKEMRENIDEIQEALWFLQNKTENVTKSMKELDSEVNRFLSDMIKIRIDLENTIEVLDTYTQKDPATILKPVTVDVKPVFLDKNEIFNRLPGLMAIVLLFITLFISSSQIVGERKGGTMARIFLSPISMFFYIFEKMLYLLLLSLVAFGSMVAAVLLFDVSVSFSIEVLLIAIVAGLAYTAIGVLIGSISKSENTSLLTCLVVGFPLMFLSGAFSPPELMGKFWRVATEYLPLTLNVNLLERVMIYKTGIDAGMLWTLIGLTVVLYLLSVWMIKRKPTLK